MHEFEKVERVNGVHYIERCYVEMYACMKVQGLTRQSIRFWGKYIHLNIFQ